MRPAEKKTTTESIELYKQSLEGNNYSPQSIKAYLSVKPKGTRPVSMLGILMQHSLEIDRCIVPQMHVGSAHPERHGVGRDCTPLASW
jgi:hypothetical protein